MVTGLLEEWGLPDEVPAFELAVSELVSNALLHGAGDIRLHLSCDPGGRVRLEVRDQGHRGNGASRPHMAARRFGGWGLRFVDRLAESWGAEHRDEGTLVWMVKQATRGTGAGSGDVGQFRLVSQA